MFSSFLSHVTPGTVTKAGKAIALFAFPEAAIPIMAGAAYLSNMHPAVMQAAISAVSSGTPQNIISAGKQYLQNNHPELHKAVVSAAGASSAADIVKAGSTLLRNTNPNIHEALSSVATRAAKTTFVAAVLAHVKEKSPDLHAAMKSAVQKKVGRTGGRSQIKQGVAAQQKVDLWKSKVIRLLNLVESSAKVNNPYLRRYLNERENTFATFKAGLASLSNASSTPTGPDILFYLSKRPGVYISRLEKLKYF